MNETLKFDIDRFRLDIEEDLNQLGALTLTETNVNVDVDPLKKANERIRQLEEIVGTLRSNFDLSS